MSVLKHYIIFGLLFWLAVSERLNVFTGVEGILKVVCGIIIFLFFVAVLMTLYVVRQRKKKEKRNGEHSPLL